MLICMRKNQHSIQTVWRNSGKMMVGKLIKTMAARIHSLFSTRVATCLLSVLAIQLAPNQLLYQQKRYRGKINIRKPKIFYKKAVLNELLTPFFVDPNEGKSLEQFCLESSSQESERPLGPYDRILAREARNWFDNAKMIGCLHVNSIPELEKFDTRVLLHRANMYFKYYSPHIINEALKNSPYETFKPLVSKFTSFVFSPEINVAKLQAIIKKSKKIFLIAGALEGHVLKLDDFLKYGNVDMATAQCGLVQVLQSAGGATLNQQLTHHQSTLVARLKQIGTNEATPDNKE